MRSSVPRLRRPAILATITAVLVGALTPLLVVGAAPALADGPTLTAAGSTFSQIAIDQWRSDVASKYGLSINYSGVGSSAGRQFYIGSQVDFAASEIPFDSDEVAKLTSEGKSYEYSPDVAGATSIMYNFKDTNGQQVVSLNMRAHLLGGIFTGRVTNICTDPDFIVDNPGLKLEDASCMITPTVRSDGSGTSAQFSAYLKSQDNPDWEAFAKSQLGGDDAPISNWPTFGNAYAAKGSDGVANYVVQNEGGITYDETGYAIQRHFPVASVHNASGAFVQPTSGAVATALKAATLNSDRTQNLEGVYNNPDPGTYPISSYSYVILPTTGFNPDKGKVLGEFMIYVACAGQQKAAVLGYSPLPENLVQTVFSAIQQIPGAPAPPPLNQCANPNIPGAVDGGIPGIGGGASKTAATGTRAASASGAVAKTATKTAKGKAADAASTGVTGTTVATGAAPGTATTTAGAAGAVQGVSDPTVAVPGSTGVVATAAGPAAVTSSGTLEPAAGAVASTTGALVKTGAAFAASKPVALDLSGSTGASVALPAVLLLVVLLVPPVVLVVGPAILRRRRHSAA